MIIIIIDTYYRIYIYIYKYLKFRISYITIYIKYRIFVKEEMNNENKEYKMIYCKNNEM